MTHQRKSLRLFELGYQHNDTSMILIIILGTISNEVLFVRGITLDII